MANTEKREKQGSDSLIVLYCLSSLVAMTVVMVVSHPWKRPCEALWACFALWLLPSPRWKQSLIVRWVGVTGCLNSDRDNWTIGTGRPTLFIWGNCLLKHITIDVCYAQNWTRKTTTHARLLKVLSLNVIACNKEYVSAVCICMGWGPSHTNINEMQPILWDGVRLLAILLKCNQCYGVGSVSY